MLDFAEYLAIKKCNPDESCYIENIIYEIEDCHSTISMWNGYEIERVFNIKEPNIKDVFNDEQWERINKCVVNSKFWLDNWRYSDAINEAFKNEGIFLKSVNRRPPLKGKKDIIDIIKESRSLFVGTYFGYTLKRIFLKLFQKRALTYVANPENLFYSTNENIYGGHYLQFRYKGNSIEKIDKEIRKNFCFPELTDEKNLKCLEIILNSNSVSIHARRGDMLGINKYCYEYGYFKRAVDFIKKKVNNPVFFFFCDPNSIEWCKENYKIFGLEKSENAIYFVDWNKGEDSYKDMQLMSKCKHNIITNSSFGWWGAYLNENAEKITCSPDIRINTTHSF